MGEILCKAVNSDKKIQFESAVARSTNLSDVLKEDKKYGKMSPRNGRYFTYRILNKDQEVTEKQVRRAAQMAWSAWALELPFGFVRVKPHVKSDFSIEFRATSDDPQLDDNTLMYMYYPINSINAPNRGLCVVNTDYYWTNSGKPVNMHKIDPVNYPDEATAPVQGMSWDLDQVLRHEFGHGLGLPHSSTRDTIMAPNYGLMSEHLDDEDIKRMVHKYGARYSSPWDWFRQRFYSWFRKASDE